MHRQPAEVSATQRRVAVHLVVARVRQVLDPPVDVQVLVDPVVRQQAQGRVAAEIEVLRVAQRR